MRTSEIQPIAPATPGIWDVAPLQRAAGFSPRGLSDGSKRPPTDGSTPRASTKVILDAAPRGLKPAARRCGVRRRGVTLLEILVVVGIIIILVTISIVAFGGQSKAAKNRLAQQQIHTLTNAIEEYRHANGGLYPGYVPAGNLGGYWSIPFDPDTIANTEAPPSAPDHPPYRSIGPVVKDENPSQLGRPDYFQKHRPSPGDGTLGSAQADVHDPNPPSNGNPFLPGSVWMQRGTQNMPDTSPAGRVYSIEALVYFLNSESGAQKVLQKLENAMAGRTTDEYRNAKLARPDLLNDSDFTNGEGIRGFLPSLQNLGPPQEPMAIVDPWGIAYHYGFDRQRNNGVPYVISAGDDKTWNTDDDVSSINN